MIVNKFAHYFADSSSTNNVTRASELYDEFTCMREQYCGAPFKDEFLFDVKFDVHRVTDPHLRFDVFATTTYDALRTVYYYYHYYY